MGKKDEPAFLPVPEQSASEGDTLFELAKRHGQLLVSDSTKLRFQALDPHESPFKPTHQVAAVYHGWRTHEHTKHQLVRLTDADYLAALTASKKGNVHPAADRRDQEQKGA